MPSAKDLILLSMIGLFGGAANLWLSQSYKFSEVSLVSPLKYLALIFGIIFGYFIWNEIPTIKTLLGRKRRFNMWEPRDSWGERAYSLSEAHSHYPKQELKRAYTHTAMNALIQGSSADITKAAMIKIYEAGLLDEIDLKLTVHDELDFSVPQDKQKCFEDSLQIMKTCVDLKVPLTVDVEKGDSWGTIK